MKKVTKSECVLVHISENEREKLFSKDIVGPGGQTIRLYTGVPAARGSAESYAQGVSVGRVLLVADDIDFLQVDDVVVLDYTVDMDDSIIVEQDEKGKSVIVRAVTHYRDHTLIVDPTRDQKAPHPTTQYREGELDYTRFGLIIAVVRDGVITPVAPYIFCKRPKDDGWEEQRGSGILLLNEEVKQDNDSSIAEREIIFNYPGAPEDIKPGNIVCCHIDAAFPRALGKDEYDVVPYHEVVAVLVKKEVSLVLL